MVRLLFLGQVGYPDKNQDAAKKSESTGSNAKEYPKDLSSSGESDFLLAAFSGVHLKTIIQESNVPDNA